MGMCTLQHVLCLVAREACEGSKLPLNHASWHSLFFHLHSSSHSTYGIVLPACTIFAGNPKVCTFEPNINKSYGMTLYAVCRTSVPEGCAWLPALAPGAAACLPLASVISAARRNSSKHRRTSPDTAATCTATTLNPVHHSQVTRERYGLYTKSICQACSDAQWQNRTRLFWWFCFWQSYLMMGAFFLLMHTSRQAPQLSTCQHIPSCCSLPCAYQAAITWLPLQRC